MANLAEVRKVDRLWTEEAKRRLEEYRAGRAHVVRAEAVHANAQKLFR